MFNSFTKEVKARLENHITEASVYKLLFGYITIVEVNATNGL